MPDILFNEYEDKEEYEFRTETPEAPDKVPYNKIIDSLTRGDNPVIRAWKDGKYKCASLRKFIYEYNQIADGLNANLILDYLIQDTGKPYTKQTVKKSLTLHGMGRE